MYKEAKDNYNLAIKYKENNSEAYFNLGNL